ncbi:hypothetical protein GJAV_G00188740 [Gymnothorax javanicus]|nr:hypothetical protein GJAV_G00188740 [Gymnothorax javanicus]
MSEKYGKLKLKRKKAAVPGDKCGQTTSIDVIKSTGIPIASFAYDVRPGTPRNRYGSKPGAWWDHPDLQAAEKLWAVTLKSAIPNLGLSVWETVPDLPVASLVTQSVEEQCGWKWSSLTEDVGPLPSPEKHFAQSSAALDRCGRSHQLKPTDTSPVSRERETPHHTGQQEKGHPSSVPCQEGGGERASARNLGSLDCQPEIGKGWQPQSCQPSWKVPAVGAGRGDGDEGSSAARKDSLQGAGTDSAEGRGIKRRLFSRSEEGSHCHSPEDQHRSALSAVGEGSGNGQAPQNSAGRTTASVDPPAMENCPMCLLPFPPGFTQMESDSHLAKCLSEISEDITW